MKRRYWRSGSARGAGFHRGAQRAKGDFFTSRDFPAGAVARFGRGAATTTRSLPGICLDKQKFIVITSPLKFIPEEVERSFIVMDLPPPDLPELIDFLRAEGFQNGHLENAGSEETIYQIGRGAAGLSVSMRRAMRCGARSPSVRFLGPQSMPALFRGKEAPHQPQQARSSSSLTAPPSARSAGSEGAQANG